MAVWLNPSKFPNIIRKIAKYSPVFKTKFPKSPKTRCNGQNPTEISESPEANQGMHNIQKKNPTEFPTAPRNQEVNIILIAYHKSQPTTAIPLLVCMLSYSSIYPTPALVAATFTYSCLRCYIHTYIHTYLSLIHI